MCLVMKLKPKETNKKDSICFKVKKICVQQNEKDFNVIKIENIEIIKEKKYKRWAWKEMIVSLWKKTKIWECHRWSFSDALLNRENNVNFEECRILNGEYECYAILKLLIEFKSIIYIEYHLMQFLFKEYHLIQVWWKTLFSAHPDTIY